jgi:hypothetical protein
LAANAESSWKLSQPKICTVVSLSIRTPYIYKTSEKESRNLFTSALPLWRNFEKVIRYFRSFHYQCAFLLKQGFDLAVIVNILYLVFFLLLNTVDAKFIMRSSWIFKCTMRCFVFYEKLIICFSEVRTDFDEDSEV